MLTSRNKSVLIAGAKDKLWERNCGYRIFLTNLSRRCRIVDKFALRADLEFHAEWLRDEPCDATATGSGSYILTARCQLPPGNGEHEIRMRSLFVLHSDLFSLFLEKEAFVF
jgi:hypothetical protein